MTLCLLNCAGIKWMKLIRYKIWPVGEEVEISQIPGWMHYRTSNAHASKKKKKKEA